MPRSHGPAPKLFLRFLNAQGDEVFPDKPMRGVDNAVFIASTMSRHHEFLDGEHGTGKHTRCEVIDVVSLTDDGELVVATYPTNWV